MAKLGRRPKLTPDDKQHIRELYRKPGYSMPMIARLFRVSAGTIAKAINEGDPK